MPTPYDIISELHPFVVEGARLAATLQSRVRELDGKEDAPNVFAAALSDADIAVQAVVEAAHLNRFPGVPFYGEEYATSRLTPYLAGTRFVEGCPYLVTLDPVDGTRAYLDGHAEYQVILVVASRARIEAVTVIFPALDECVYALAGRGAFRGRARDPLSAAAPHGIPAGVPRSVFVEAEFEWAAPALSAHFSDVKRRSDYRKDTPPTSFASLLRGGLCGGVGAGAQLIDGAALLAVAAEMGYVVEPLRAADDGPGSWPDLIRPGFVVGDTAETVSAIRGAVRAGQER